MNITTEFIVTGMTCSACSSHVKKSVTALNGVKNLQVSLLTNSMSVEHEDFLSPNDIIRAVISAGYGAEIKGEKSESLASSQSDETAILKKRLISSLCFLVPLMYIAVSRMFSLPFAEIFKTPAFVPAFVLTQLLLTLPVVVINFKFYKNGFKSLIHFHPNMDTLVATGSAAALIYGIYALYSVLFLSASGNFSKAFAVSENLYFESAAMILTLITAGKMLEAKAKAKTTDAVNSLVKLLPSKARVIRNGKELVLNTSELFVGDEIIVKSGENIPCDGTIIYGSGTVDESAITGESIPLAKNQGDLVTGATILLSGYVVFRADAVGKDTIFSKIVRLVQEAASNKAPIARIADKVCAVFVPSVMAISIITFIVWYLATKSIQTALNFSISVLVISCPCALGLATPTAIMAGTGKGAKLGLLFKNAQVLELLHKVNVLVTDKTGTLTKGVAQVSDIIPAPGITDELLLSYAVSIEKNSHHPLSSAIIQKGANISVKEISEFNQINGGGLECTCENKELLAGNEMFLSQKGISVPSHESLKNQGKTVLYFSYDKKYLGAIAVSDMPREDSRKTVAGLKKLGIEVIMLTGDNEITAKSIANSLGITRVISQATPQSKQQVISELKSSGKVVAMVGDGVNDAPALASAHIGIAIGGATDAAINSADVILMHRKFSDCLSAISLSHAVMRNIKQNLFWAFFYNILGIPLAAGVLFSSLGVALNPMVASLSMSLSSIFVVTNALRLRYFKSQIKTQVKEIKTMKKIMKIKGMMCPHCTGRTENALNAIDGVEAVVDLTDGGTAIITLNKDVSDNLLIKAVTDAGYEVISIN